MANEKEKSIETSQLKITGNIMTWEDTMIQLANVSSISTTPLVLRGFPWWTLFIFIIGFILKKNSGFLMFLCFVIGAAGIIWWYVINETRKESINLNLMLNSGYCFSIQFKDRTFVNKVLEVLKCIIKDGGIGQNNITINVSGNNFSGNADILNRLNIK